MVIIRGAKNTVILLHVPAQKAICRPRGAAEAKSEAVEKYGGGWKHVIHTDKGRWRSGRAS